jgi:uncharacterized delta-60 repeat protein
MKSDPAHTPNVAKLTRFMVSAGRPLLSAALLGVLSLPAAAAPADLDTTFSSDGWALADIFGSSDVAGEVALMSDGRIVAAGTVFPETHAGPLFGIVRFLASGALDTSYAGDGKGAVDLDYNDEVGGLAVQSDGKVIVVGQSYDFSGFQQISATRTNANGTLDTTFSGDGKQYVPVGPDWTIGTDVTIQSDGKIVIGGYSANSAGRIVFVCVRLNANGTLDTTFSGDGKASVAVGTGDARCYDVNMNGSNILLTGNASNGANDDFALVQLTSAGAVDTSFSGDGVVMTDFSGGADVINEAAIQPDGKIVAAGRAGTSLAVARYTASGVLDASFSGDGKLMALAGTTVSGVALQGNGKIVLAGRTDTQARVTRLLPDGDFDSSFGSAGSRSFSFSGNYPAARHCAVQPDGKIVLVGSDSPGEYPDMLVFRLQGDPLIAPTATTLAAIGISETSATLQGTINPNAWATTVAFDYGPTASFGTTVAAPDAGSGSTAVTRSVTLPGLTPGTTYFYRVRGVNAHGTGAGSTVTFTTLPSERVDPTFGGGAGKVTTPFSTSADDIGRAIAQALDGDLIVAGETMGADFNFGIARYNPNGSLDTGFSGDGIESIGFGSGQIETVRGVVVQPDGKPVLVGGTYVP